MIDREKVIDYLKWAIAEAELTGHTSITLEPLKDALTLLKEQDEGIEPEISRKSVTETTVSLWYKCGACGGAIEQGDDEFCRHCGKGIEWEGEDDAK